MREPIFAKAVEAAAHEAKSPRLPTPAPSRFLEALAETKAVVEASSPEKDPPAAAAASAEPQAPEPHKQPAAEAPAPEVAKMPPPPPSPSGSAWASRPSKPQPPRKLSLSSDGSEGATVPPSPSASKPAPPPKPSHGMDSPVQTRDGLAVPASPSLYRPGKRFPGMPDSPMSNATGSDTEATTPPPPPPRAPGRPDSPMTHPGPGPALGSPEGIQRLKMNGSLRDLATQNKGKVARSPMSADGSSEPPPETEATAAPATGAPPPPPPPPGKKPKGAKLPGPKLLGLPGLSVDTDLENTVNSTMSMMSHNSTQSSDGESRQSPSGKKRGLSLGGMAQASSAVRALPKPPSPSGAASRPSPLAKAPPTGPGRPVSAAMTRGPPGAPPPPPGKVGVAGSPKAGAPGNAW